MSESFYDLLGVPADANTAEIRRAYRQRIKETHPDVNDDADASAQTARLVEARDVLTDETERARYDRLGHDAYVNDRIVGDSDDGGPERTQTDGDTRSNSKSTGPTNARADAEERRRRERRARRDVDFGTGSTTSGTGSSESTTAAANGGATTGGDTRSTGSGVHSRTDPSEPPSWSDTSQGWAARRPTDPAPGLTRHVVAALKQAPATAIVTFLLYPLVVLGAFLPGFPLAVNVIVGACLLAMVAATQSVPGLGIAIYGTWSLLAPVGLLWTGTHPFSPLGLVALGTTWLPFGFSLLTYQVLDA